MQFLKHYLARYYAKFYSQEMFVGITGSTGKTVCVAFGKAVLSRKYQTISTDDTNNLSNIPSTILKITPKIKKVILEMGIEGKDEVDYYLSIIKPKIAIVTNVAYDHNANIGNISSLLQEKRKLLDNLGKDGVAILNWDDPSCRKLADKYQGNVLYFGTDSTKCTIWADHAKIENFATTFELNLGVERVKVNLKMLGFHHIYPALAAALLGVVCGIPLTQIKLALETVESKEHYLQPLLGPNGSVILDDTYESSPNTLDSAIDTLLAVPARRRIIVLGEMKDLASFGEELNKSVAQRIYKEKLDFVFLGQGQIKIIADELQSLGFWEERLEVNLQNSQLVVKLLQILGKGDVCLIKGARSVRLDEVVKRIIKR